MVKDDRLFTTRVALFARVGEVGVTEACRQFQVHRSTYYRWKASVERNGLEILRPRDDVGRQHSAEERQHRLGLLLQKAPRR